MTDLVSIVTPLYNAEKTIAETIESVLAQTYTNWELNVVDDCSTDSSAEIVKKYMSNDSRIKYFRLDSNSGAAVARNTSMKMANGRYLAFLDSDDLWHKEKLEKQIFFMQINNVAFSFTEYSMFNKSGIINKHVRSPKKITFISLLTGSPIMCSSVMLDMNLISKFEMPIIRSGQDYATWALLLREQLKFAYNINENMSRYRKQDKSLSSQKLKSFMRTWYINKEVLNIPFVANAFYISIYSLRWFKKHYLSKSL